MFAAFRPSTSTSAASARVEALARERFALHADEVVAVNEVASGLPGCPPLETVIAFWTDRDDGSTQRHHCKVFKPLRDVVADDLPPAWMKPALAVAPGYACDCC